MTLRSWCCFLMIFMICSPGEALQIQELKTLHGVTVWLAPQEGPIVSLQIAFKGAGKCTDPVGKAGRAETFSALSLEGAGSLDAGALAARLEDLCSSITLFANDDHMMVSIVALRKNITPTLQLARDILFKPRSEQHALEKVKKQAIAALDALQGDPGYLLRKAFAQVNFKTHPYGCFPTQQSLEALTLEDMKDYKRFWGIDNLVITMSGSLTPQEATQIVQDLCAGLPPHADTVLIEDISVPTEGVVYNVDVDIPQSMVHFFQPSLQSHRPDFHALVVLDSILGGGSALSSRLFKKVRVESGYAYRVGTCLVDQEHHVRWDGAMGSQNDTVLSAVHLIQQEWMRVSRGGIGAQELEATQRYLTGSWALNFKTSQQIAWELMNLRLEGRGADYVNTRNSLIQAVSLEDLNRVARLHLKPSSLSFIIVGRPKPHTSVIVKPLKLNTSS